MRVMSAKRAGWRGLALPRMPVTITATMLTTSKHKELKWHA